MNSESRVNELTWMVNDDSIVNDRGSQKYPGNVNTSSVHQQNMIGGGFNPYESVYDKDGDSNNQSLYHDVAVEAQRYKVCIVLSGVNILVLIVLFALTLVIWRRDSFHYLWWLGLNCLLGVACAVIALMWAQKSKSSANDVSGGLKTFKEYVWITFCSNTVISAILLVMAANYFLHKPMHFNQLNMTYYDIKTWENMYYENWSFRDGWHQSKVILNWCVILAVISSTLFTVVASCSWFLIPQNSRTTIIRQMICLLGCLSVFFSIFAFSFGKSALKYVYTASLYNYTDTYYYTLTLWFLGITAFIVVANVLLVSVKMRILSLFFGILLIISAIVLLSVGGMALRTNRNLQLSRLPKRCKYMVSDASLDELSSWCNNKYLDNNDYCENQHRGPWWEKYPDNSQTKNLNPACCYPAVNYYTYPTFKYGIMLLYFIAMILLLANFNFYLMEGNEETISFGNIQKTKENLLIFFIALITLTIILIIVMIYSVSVGYSDISQNPSAAEYVKDMRGEPAWTNYPVVPASLTKVTAPLAQKCFSYDGAILPAFSIPKCEFASKNCGMRVSILSRDSIIKTTTKNTSANKSDLNLRCSIFTGNNNKADSFVNLFGSVSAVNTDFKDLQFCDNTIKGNIVLYIVAEVVDLSKLMADGVKKTELMPTSCKLEEHIGKPNAGRIIPNVNQFTNFKRGDCSGNCKIRTEFKTIFGTVDVKFALSVTNCAEEWVPYPPAGDNNFLVAKLQSENKEVIDSGFWNSNSNNLELTAPSQQDKSYTAQISVEDGKGKYNHLLKDIVIPKMASGVISTPTLRLVNSEAFMKASKLPKQENGVTCLQNQVRKSTITIALKNIQTEELIPNAIITLRYTESKFGAELSKKETNRDNNVGFYDVSFGNYNIEATADGYDSIHDQTLQVNESSQSHVFYMMKTNDNLMNIRLEMTSNYSNTDVDQILSIVNEDGTNCTVSPVNKYCAHAIHQMDDRKGLRGMELISVSKLTLSYYLAYAQKNVPYAGTCKSPPHIAKKPFTPYLKERILARKQRQENIRNVQNEEVDTKSNKFKITLAQAGKTTPVVLPVGDLGTNYKYWKMFCFTGYGEDSIHYINEYTLDTKQPNAIMCEQYYTAGTYQEKYSLAKLKANMYRK